MCVCYVLEKYYICSVKHAKVVLRVYSRSCVRFVRWCEVVDSLCSCLHFWTRAIILPRFMFNPFWVQSRLSKIISINENTLGPITTPSKPCDPGFASACVHVTPTNTLEIASSSSSSHWYRVQLQHTMLHNAAPQPLCCRPASFPGRRANEHKSTSR